MSARKRIVVVLGCHRAGTSLLMDALARMGVDLGDGLLGSDAWNEAGYHEVEAIFRAQDEILEAISRPWQRPEGVLPHLEMDWRAPPVNDARQRLAALIAERSSGPRPFGFKDPRTASLLPLWQGIFEELGLEPIYILAVRHPEAVAASLARRDGAPLPQGRLLWLRTYHDALRHARGRLAAIVHYERWFEEPDRMLVEIAQAIAPAFDAPPHPLRADTFVRGDLRHEVANASTGPLAEMLDQTWRILSAPRFDADAALRFVSDICATLDAHCASWQDGRCGDASYLLPRFERESLGRGEEARGEIWTVRLERSTSRCLFQQPPARARLDIEGAYPGVLRTAVALHPDVWEREDSGPCRFDVEIDRRATASIVLDPSKLGDRRWHELLLPVPSANRTHEIVFSTRTLGQGESFRWGLWREPVFTAVGSQVPADAPGAMNRSLVLEGARDQ